MVDTRRLVRLLEIAERAGAKVVLTGDDRQLPSVEAGGGFGALGRELGATRLGANARQVAEWSAALDALREGRAGEAAAAYSHHGRVHRSTNPSELIGDMVERWWAAARESPAMTPSSTPTPGTAVRVLNGLAHLHVEKAGRLLGPELVVEEFTPADLAPRTYRVGDELCCLRNRTRLGAGRDPSGKGVRNGTRGIVRRSTRCSERSHLRRADAASALRLPADYVKRSTDYGYAWTLHKGQGQSGRPAGGEAAPRVKWRTPGVTRSSSVRRASAPRRRSWRRVVRPTRRSCSCSPSRTRRRTRAMGTKSWAGRGAAASGSDSPSTRLEPGARDRPPRRNSSGDARKQTPTRSFRWSAPVPPWTSRSRQADATRELGISLVQHDEAQEEAGVFATISATSEGVERRNLQGPYTASATSPCCTRSET